MKRSDETTLQIAIADLLDVLRWCWCHVPNGGARSRTEGAIFQRMGVKPGVPDILIFERWQDASGAIGHGFALELKSEKGRLRQTQREWLAELAARGWKTAVARSLDEAMRELECVKPLSGWTIEAIRKGRTCGR